MKTSREITIYDVAKELNISPSTVSRGLKDHPHIRKETIRRIKAAAHKMGYRRNKFASNLRLSHTNTLGLVVPKLNSYFMATVIAGIEKVTNVNGYGLIISTSQENEKQEISSVNTLFNSRVDGLMVSLAFDTREVAHFNTLLNKNIPIVFFDRVSECPGCMSIVIDNFKAGYEAATHLIEQGCRRIVHMGGNLRRNVYSDRLKGYRKALQDNGIRFDKKLVIINELSSVAAAIDVAKILKLRPLPDGIFTANDTSAVAVIVELLKAGIRIPDDICVVGFNNDPVSQVIKPNLTTVDYPAEEIGEIVATSLINRLRNQPSDMLNKIILNHKLIKRESSLRKNIKEQHK